jgi:uncharacterized protein
MSRFLSGLLLLAGGLGSMADSALAADPSIKDDAGLFSPTALESAREEGRRIERRYKRVLVLETYAGIPAAMRKEFNPAVKDRFFQEWARDRAAKRGVVSGVYLLICKEPAHVEVVVKKRFYQATFFTPENRKELEALLERDLWSRPDPALTEAVGLVDTAYRKNLGYDDARYPDDAAASWLPFVFTAILVLAGIWLVLGVTRAVLGPRPAGGSFLGSLMGGLFGAAAGLWIYDSIFNSSARAPGPDPDAPAESGGEV